MTPQLMLAQTDPRMTPQSIVKGLGLDSALEQSWAKFLGDTLDGAPNELIARKSLHDKMRGDRLDPVLRNVIFQRAMTYYRGRLEKSGRAEVFTDLQKAFIQKYNLEKKNSEAWNKLEAFHSNADEDEGESHSGKTGDSKEWQMLEDFHTATDDEDDAKHKEDSKHTKVLNKPKPRDAEDDKPTGVFQKPAAAGPFIGPKGGKYADANHTVAWHGEGMQKAILMSPDALAAEIGGKVKRDNAAQSVNAKRKKADAEYARAKKAEEKTKLSKSMSRGEIHSFYVKRAKERSEEVQKAEARGGSYHKRVTREDGKHRYYYDPDKYASSKDAQVDGAEAEKKRIRSLIDKRLDEGNCSIEHFKELAKKYGADKVGESLRAGHGDGTIKFENGLFSKAEPMPGKASTAGGALPATAAPVDPARAAVPAKQAKPTKADAPGKRAPLSTKPPLSLEKSRHRFIIGG